MAAVSKGSGGARRAVFVTALTSGRRDDRFKPDAMATIVAGGG